MMMTMIFQFTQNSHTHRIMVDEKDVSLKWKRMNGDAFVKVRFTKCIIPKGSEVTTNHGKAISTKAKAERNKFLSTNSGKASKIAGSEDIDWKYETLTQDHEMSDNKGLEMTHLMKVVAGGSISGPSQFKYVNRGERFHNYSMNEFFGIEMINQSTDLILESKDQLYILTNLYRSLSPTESFASFVRSYTLALNMKRVLEWNRNIILEGVPGVGKTWNFDRLLKILGISKDDGDRVASVTFSPSMGTEEFIGGLFPRPGRSPPVFSFDEGPLLSLAEKAASSDPNKIHVLFIDEINRGNIPKIMGEIMTVIESSKRFTVNGTTNVLATSNDEGEVFRAAMFSEGGQVRYLGLPENLYIVGAMNTSDRSVIQIDSALRRRFAFIRVETMLVKKSHEDLVSALRSANNASTFWSSDERIERANEVFEELYDLNESLLDSLGPDGMLGHSYLFDLKCCDWTSLETQSAGAEEDETQGNGDQPADVQAEEAPEGKESADNNADQADDEGQDGSVEPEDCFWKAIRDMLLLTLYPQLADTVAANGVSDQHVEIINGHITSLNDIVNYHLEQDLQLNVKIKKPDSSFGTYRLE